MVNLNIYEGFDLTGLRHSIREFALASLQTGENGALRENCNTCPFSAVHFDSYTYFNHAGHVMEIT
jgi:hypothetical protein